MGPEQDESQYSADGARLEGASLQPGEGADAYVYKQLEADIIKYICEKIVAMREQPFIDAVENLRRAQELNNLQMIMDIQKNKQKLSTNLN